MKLSFAITVKDELTELKRLLDILIPYRAQELDTEIVILYDSKNGSEEVKEYLTSNMGVDPNSVYYYLYNYSFEGDFAAMKNTLNKLCKGDFIVNLDADEIPNEYLISILPSILKSNTEVDVYLIPRINTVDNLGLSHIQKWGWNVSKLDTQIGEKELDLNNPQDKDEYELLKKYNLIIEETISSK